MKNRYFPFLCAFVFLFTNCDPSYDVDYDIRNSTGYSLQIQFQGRLAGRIDTSTISRGTKLTIYNETGIGYYTDDYLDYLTELPLLVLDIRTTDGKVYNKEVLNLCNWEKIYPDKNRTTDLGIVVLEVSEDDLE